MGDLSDMPPLVDSMGGNGAARYGPPFPGSPYMGFPQPGMQTNPGTPWSNAGIDPGRGWGASNGQSVPSSPPWPPHPPTPWGNPAFVMSPNVRPATVNPAMPTGGDGWPRSMDDNDYLQASGYFNKRDESEGWQTGRSASRPLTPYSGSTHTSSPASTTSKISRSRSVRSIGGGENSKRPPREWRVDFSMSKSLGFAALGAMFTKARSASISGGILDNSKHPKLHPYLRYSSSAPAMHLDLRLNPSTLRFRALERDVNPWDLTRFACEPPVPVMRLYSSHYPWYIDAESSNPAGVTLHELFSAIWVSMMTPISQGDYWNNEMDERARERIAEAWAERCEDDEERKKGVRRVDFLMGRVILEGLVRGKEGMWEMRMKKLS